MRENWQILTLSDSLHPNDMHVYLLVDFLPRITVTAENMFLNFVTVHMAEWH